MDTADDRDLRIARTREHVTRNLLIHALLGEHHARMHLALARFGAASLAASLASVLITPLLLPLAAVLAVVVLALLIRLRRDDATIRARHGGATIKLPPLRRQPPGSAVVAAAVEHREYCQRSHDAALAALLVAEAA